MTATTPRGAGRRKGASEVERRPSVDDVGIDPRMLELLVCPQTHGPLTFDEAAQELRSDKAKLAFPVRSGLPVLLVSEARALED